MRPAAFALLVCALLAGCGGERVFTASEFTDAVNDEGGGLELGEALVSTREGIEIYAIELSTGAEGSLTVTLDPDAGTEEYRRCDTSAALRCYRAANIVLAFQEEDLPDQGALAGIDGAIRSLAGD